MQGKSRVLLATQTWPGSFCCNKTIAMCTCIMLHTQAPGSANWQLVHPSTVEFLVLVHSECGVQHTEAETVNEETEGLQGVGLQPENLADRLL
eukprot:221625-Pelagomonas_calceolata.AAC.1